MNCYLNSSETSDHYDVFQNYEIEADQRDSLKEFSFEKRDRYTNSMGW